MAEAIGLVASVASLLDLALKLSNTLHDLQFQVRNAPYLIQALENETEAIRTVLAHVENTIQSTAAARLSGPGSSVLLGDLAIELGKGAAVLKELSTFIDSLKKETSTLRRVKWVHKGERAAELIKELKEVRSRISELQLAYGKHRSSARGPAKHNTNFATRMGGNYQQPVGNNDKHYAAWSSEGQQHHSFTPSMSQTTGLPNHILAT
ncbi:hypothetical protein FOYG_14999 [Fusarium oxysporum NRRL 32931]|uniref:Fungal N-terminal domain-containing protein n=1 Tax=Fusarium oxysporum NRRL 32931 TaxID=660029 RepID=W9HRT6_FUSOX|nr:hypothetical protein FOYG_14999 [Fusarium oxysporum NRRL 32931]